MVSFPKENPLGLVSSKNEREMFFQKHFEAYEDSSIELVTGYIEALRIKAGLKKGTNFQADRDRNRIGNKFQRDSAFFSNLLGTRKLKAEPFAYHIDSDEVLFFKNFDVANDPIPVLEKGLSNKDLLSAGKERLFKFLKVGASKRRALFARPFHSGLKKILDQRE